MTAPLVYAHSGNPEVRNEVIELKQPQHVAWAVQREDGGRGFGFTGGHFHRGWANDDQRKLVLNAILWVAGVEVPANGVESKVTTAMLRANLDPKGGRGGAAPNPTLSSMTALTALPRQKVTDARRALVYNALANPALLKQTRLLNSQTGQYENVTITALGDEVIEVRGAPVTAKRYRILGSKHPIELWYGPGERWLALQSSLEGGRKLRYLLK